MRHAIKASEVVKMELMRSRELELGIKERTKEKNWAPCRFVVSWKCLRGIGLGCRACGNKRMLRMWLVHPRVPSGVACLLLIYLPYI